MSKKIKQIFVDGETYDIGGDALPEGGNTGDVLTKTDSGAEWANVGTNPYGDGSDGDFTLTSGTCYLEAKEYNFNNFTHAGGSICFYGNGVPVIRVAGEASLTCGSINLYNNCCGGTWLPKTPESKAYQWSGPVVNNSAILDVNKITDYNLRSCGNGKGGMLGCNGETNVLNGANRCAGGAYSTNAGGGGGGYTVAGGAASSGVGGTGGCSDYGQYSITFHSDSSDHDLGAGGGGYGDTTGGAGGLLASTCLRNGYNVCCCYVGAMAGSGGNSLGTGGNGGQVNSCNIYAAYVQSGNGGRGCTKGGNGGTVYVLGGNQHALCYNGKRVRAGDGGGSDRCGGCGGSVCFCGTSSCLCGMQYIAGRGGDGYTCRGGNGGCITTKIKVTGESYVDSTTFYGEAGFYGGSGGCGKCGGTGGCIQVTCCSNLEGMTLQGGRGGDGYCKGGDGGSVATASCTLLLRVCQTGGDGGNAIGGTYSLLMAANKMNSSRCYSFNGTGGCGGNGGSITNNSSCEVSQGHAGNGGNGANGANAYVYYGSIVDGSTTPRSNFAGGCGGVGGTISGLFKGTTGGNNGTDGKAGTFIFTKLNK